MLIIITSAFVLASSVIAWYILVLPGMQLLKKFNHPLRAVGKRYGQLNLYDGPEKAVIQKLLKGIFIISLLLWLLAVVLSYKTDYSFMAILFPFIMYYWGIRFFLWEKSDLTESSKKSESAV